MKVLLDSNIIIYLGSDKAKTIEKFLINKELCVSVITKVETLGYHKISETEKKFLNLVFSKIEVIPLEEEIIEATEVLLKYEGYIQREKLIAEKLQRLEHINIRGRIDYNSIQSLSTEARQKLTKIDPENIGQASRIPGISPSDVNILLVLLGR